ncbi:uncharacterized protein LOC131946926 [Physella acuta]|uniref:uncharacterized protein LOC131946926 n=1 Tax=Physella acuta TaxID=109671 RepID=UPI0027DB3555|nr:uncharacterized protein LOC131946926 [Physella acuta]
MKLQQLVLSTLLVVVLMVGECASLKCYSCNSFNKTQSCITPGPTTPIVECEANQTMCRKIEQQIYYNGADQTRVFRQCATLGSLGDCLERTGTYRYKSWYCHCKSETDEVCNKADSLPLSVSLTAAMLFSVFSLTKFL